MPLDIWFPLAIQYVDGAIDGPARTDAVDALRRRTSGGHDGPTAWTGDVNGDDQLHNDPAFDAVTAAVTGAAAEYLGELGYDLDLVELYAQRSWAVICRPGQYVAAHRHANAHLSAVVYLCAPPDSGALRFTNTAQPNALSPGSGGAGSLRTLNPLNYASALYQPVDGRIVLFPAQQLHDVLVNESALERISLSYDLMVSSRGDRPGGVHEFLMPPPTRWRRLDHRRARQLARARREPSDAR